MDDSLRHRPSHILLIEDNRGDVELVKLAFQHAGIHFDLAVLQDGGEALLLIRRAGKYAHTPVPDLIILDLNLPKNDGFEVLEAIRDAPDYAEVPVLVLSSSSSERERQRMTVLPVARHLTKPTDLDELMRIGTVVKELLAKQKARKT